MSERTYSCYVCQKPVTREEQEKAKRKIDELNEMMCEVVGHMDDYLGLIHCQGPEDQFDDEGHAVVCRPCQIGALYAGSIDEGANPSACFYCARRSDELEEKGHAFDCDRPAPAPER